MAVYKELSKRVLFSFVLASAIFVFLLNMVLFSVFNLTIQHQGKTIAERVTKIDATNRQANVISAIAKEYGFLYVGYDEYKPNSNIQEFHHEQVSLSLIPPNIIEQYEIVIVIINLFFIALLATIFKSLLLGTEYFKRGDHVTKAREDSLQLNTSLPKNLIHRSIHPSFSLFALVKLKVTLPIELDAHNHFEIALVKQCKGYERCAVKYLKSGALAVTLEGVPLKEEEEIGKKLHEMVFVALRHFRPDLSRKVIKVGGCRYSRNADQTLVYQQARHALTIATRNLWQHEYITPFGHITAMDEVSSNDDFMDYIRKQQYLIFFQPVFDFANENIIFSEGLLRVRHKQLGLMCAKQFINQITDVEHLIELDKSVINHVLKVMSKESDTNVVSVHLHPMSWSDKSFCQWLFMIFKTQIIARRLVLEVSFDDFYQHKLQAIEFFSRLSELKVSVSLSKVSSPLSLKEVTSFSCIKNIKLAYQLVCNVDKKLTQQVMIKQLVRECDKAQLNLYAVGVETQQELDTLKRLKVKGAQGHYYSKLLKQIELVGY